MYFTHIKTTPQKKRSAIWLTMVLVSCLLHSCFKDLPEKSIIYENDFENGKNHLFAIYGTGGLLDSTKIISFNNSKVLGRFNNNFIVLNLDTIPSHNAVKVEFDLYIHDKWEGNYIYPAATNPDIWQMSINGNSVFLTTFSNGMNSQSFPDNFNYNGNPTNNKAFSNSWGFFPGVCSNMGQMNGSSWYKIQYTTSHTGAFQLAINDVLYPANSLCLKSWSIDNIRITAITYK
ncbi:MAG: hypothetical protein IBJ16_04320 [Chitinophagaceae bacterium]|nr:hypothetical protein [Chitinophagaceae bacterium]